MKTRSCGILQHITSLPSAYGIGDLGPEAYGFVDFWYKAGHRCWQILPLNPTTALYDNSPYHGASSCARNPLLLSPELLAQEGLLAESDIQPVPAFAQTRVDFEAVTDYKEKLFDKAHERFVQAGVCYDFQRFCAQESQWLDDFALFMALKKYYQGRAWTHWPQEVRDRLPGVLDEHRKRLQAEIERIKFLQFLFDKQWFRLKKYCFERGICIIGDLPIYVEHDSADVWSNPCLFKLDAEKNPSMVAGVPPDYFSATGQLWGNPVYSWAELRATGYAWWIRRLAVNFRLVDIVRIDHFRGLVAYWEIPAGEPPRQ